MLYLCQWFLISIYFLNNMSIHILKVISITVTWCISNKEINWKLVELRQIYFTTFIHLFIYHTSLLSTLSGGSAYVYSVEAITLLINTIYIIQEVALVVLFFSSGEHQHVECGSFNRCNGRWYANNMTAITILYTVSPINLIIYLFYTLKNGYLWLWYLQWLQHIQ